MRHDVAITVEFTKDDLKHLRIFLTSRTASPTCSALLVGRRKAAALHWGIITEKLRLAATVGGLVTHPICDCWIVGDVSKAKERLRFPHEKS